MYLLAILKTSITAPSAPYFSFDRIQLRSHYVILYFSATLVTYARSRVRRSFEFYQCMKKEVSP